MRSVPPSWQAVLGGEIEKPYYRSLAAFVDGRRKVTTVYPAEEDVFRSLDLVPFDRVRVLLLGQDPYHGAGQADGLCFSVRRQAPVPPSLRNIFRELLDDLGCVPPGHGDLSEWASRGVLLLNAVLTVEEGRPGSHAGVGWEVFTDAIIGALSGRDVPLVFCLWGKVAGRKVRMIDQRRHGVVVGAHPSPLSQRYFRGSRPFSAINAELSSRGQPEMDWCVR